MFYQYFTNKTSGKVLEDNQDFIKADLGTVFKKNDGSEYIKVDTIVFDKTSRAIQSADEADKRYGRLSSSNAWSQLNTFNNTTKILQATFQQKSCLEDGVQVQHTQLVVPDIASSHEINAKDVIFKNGKVTGSFVATCRPEFDNLTVLGNTKSNTLTVVQDSTLNQVAATAVTCATVDATNRVNTSVLTASVSGNIKDLTVPNSATVGNALTTKDLNATGNIQLNNATVQKITCNNMLPTSGSANIGSTTAQYANMYATNFNGTALRAKYADLAEKYSTDIEYQPGTVLQINAVGQSELSIFNGGTYAGVVSTKPALKMNSSTTGQYIALKGRVPVRCKGVVQKGMYCVAVEGGVVRGFSKSDITADMVLNIVGVALSDSKPDETVEVML